MSVEVLRALVRWHVIGRLNVIIYDKQKEVGCLFPYAYGVLICESFERVFLVVCKKD